jgi:Effector protein
MRQFSNTTVFINATDVASASLPRSTLTTPWYVPPPTPIAPPDAVRVGRVDAVSGAGRIWSDAAEFENHIESYLETIAGSETGQALLTSLPSSMPVVISKMTDVDKKRIGEFNAETGVSNDTLRFMQTVWNGHVKIIFPDPPGPDRGPATKPHEILMHELTHGLDMSTHGYGDERKMTGKVAGYNIPELFDGLGDFFAILMTNIMISEYGTKLRLHHRGHASIPSSLQDPKAYYTAFEKAIESLWAKNRTFMYKVSNLRKPKFNPLIHHFITEEDFP